MDSTSGINFNKKSTKPEALWFAAVEFEPGQGLQPGCLDRSHGPAELDQSLSKPFYICRVEKCNFKIHASILQHLIHFKGKANEEKIIEIPKVCWDHCTEYKKKTRRTQDLCISLRPQNFLEAYFKCTFNDGIKGWCSFSTKLNTPNNAKIMSNVVGKNFWTEIPPNRAILYNNFQQALNIANEFDNDPDYKATIFDLIGEVSTYIFEQQIKVSNL